jgi:hypothetical protein
MRAVHNGIRDERDAVTALTGVCPATGGSSVDSELDDRGWPPERGTAQGFTERHGQNQAELTKARTYL